MKRFIPALALSLLLSAPAFADYYQVGGSGGGGGGSGTVGSGTAGQEAFYASTGTTVVGNPNVTSTLGALTLGQSGTAGSIILNGATSGTGTIQVAAVAHATTFQLPASNGSNGQFLQTDGAGITSWQTPSGTGTVNSGTSGQLTYYASTGTAVSGNANATISSGALTLGQTGTAGSVTLNGSSSGTGVIQVAAAAGSGIVFQIPASNGSSGQFLQTNGAGITSWQSASGSGTVNSGTSGQLAYTVSSSGAISANGGNGTNGSSTTSDAGGGSGGGVYLYSTVSITTTGSINAVGGNGGTFTSVAGAGGGGYVIRQSPSNTGAGTVSVAAGTGYTGDGSPTSGVSISITGTPNFPLIAEHKRQWNDMVASGWLKSNHKTGHKAPMFTIARACHGDYANISQRDESSFLAAWNAKNGDFDSLCYEFNFGEVEGSGRVATLIYVGDSVDEVPSA